MKVKKIRGLFRRRGFVDRYCKAFHSHSHLNEYLKETDAIVLMLHIDYHDYMDDVSEAREYTLLDFLNDL